MRAAVRAALGLAVILLPGCAAGAPTVVPAPSLGTAGQAVVYAAVGASETVGIGGGRGLQTVRSAWPQLFYNDALPRAATLYNFGIAGITTASALTREVPQAVAVHPRLVTVWLNVNDLIAGVAPPVYEQELGRVLTALRQGGSARVLVANVPVLDHLPAYEACRIDNPSSTVQCPLGAGVSLPAPAQLASLVDAYNAAVARSALATGSVVVDLHSQGDVALTHPDWVSSDGFHPSAAGHAAVAQLFIAAYRRQRQAYAG